MTATASTPASVPVTTSAGSCTGFGQFLPGHLPHCLSRYLGSPIALNRHRQTFLTDGCAAAGSVSRQLLRLDPVALTTFPKSPAGHRRSPLPTSLKGLIFLRAPHHLTSEDCAASAREDLVSPPPINLPQPAYNRYLAQWPKAAGFLMPRLDTHGGAGPLRTIERNETRWCCC